MVWRLRLADPSEVVVVLFVCCELETARSALSGMYTVG